MVGDAYKGLLARKQKEWFAGDQFEMESILRYNLNCNGN
jgi:hypothetical protein